MWQVCSDVDKQLIFDEIIPSAHLLMTDVFGNYVLQKLFEVITAFVRLSIPSHHRLFRPSFILLSLYLPLSSHYSFSSSILKLLPPYLHPPSLPHSLFLVHHLVRHTRAMRSLGTPALRPVSAVRYVTSTSALLGRASSIIFKTFSISIFVCQCILLVLHSTINFPF